MDNDTEHTDEHDEGCECGSSYKIDEVNSTALLVAEGRTYRLRQLKLIKNNTNEIEYCVDWSALDSWMNWEELYDKWFSSEKAMEEFYDKLESNLTTTTFERGQFNLDGTVVYLTKRVISHTLIDEDDWKMPETIMEEYADRLEEDEEVFIDAFIEDHPCAEHFAEMMEKKMKGSPEIEGKSNE